MAASRKTSGGNDTLFDTSRCRYVFNNKSNTDKINCYSFAYDFKNHPENLLYNLLYSMERKKIGEDPTNIETKIEKLKGLEVLKELEELKNLKNLKKPKDLQDLKNLINDKEQKLKKLLVP